MKGKEIIRKEKKGIMKTILVFRIPPEPHEFLEKKVEISCSGKEILSKMEA